MTPTAYQQLAGRTECIQFNSLRRMNCLGTQLGRDENMRDNDHHTLVPIRVNHSIIGLTNEVGELASLLQKWIYYGKFPTEEQQAELKKQFALEFGDALWYIAEGLNALGLDMAQVMRDNIQKLMVRYPEKYTDQQAWDENRNRVKEEAHVNQNPSDGPGN